MIHLRIKLSRRVVGAWVVRLIDTNANSAQLELNLVWALQLLPFDTSVKLHITEIHISCKINFIGWMLDGWMVGESGIKANSAQFSWILAINCSIVLILPSFTLTFHIHQLLPHTPVILLRVVKPRPPGLPQCEVRVPLFGFCFRHIFYLNI